MRFSKDGTNATRARAFGGRADWRLAWPALLLAVAVARSPIALAQTTVWPAQYLPCANAAEQRVEEALLRPARLPLASFTLAELADYLSRREGVPVIIDHPAFEEAGLDPEAPLLQARSSRQSLGAALHELLSPLEMDATISSEALLITSRDEAECIPYVRLYPVVDLLMVNADDVAAYFREFSPWLTQAERTELQQFLNSPSATPSQRLTAQFGDFDALREQITTHVEEESWDHFGGIWNLEYLPGPNVLAVNVAYRGHRLLEQYLRRVRQERSGAARGLRRRPPRFTSPEEMRDAPSVAFTLEEDAETKLAALAQPVDLELQATSVDDLAGEVAHQTGLSVIVDEYILEEAGILRDMPLRNASYSGVSLAAALKHALSEYGLSYTFAGPVLVLTTVDQAECCMHTRAYAVGEILPTAMHSEWGGWQAVEPPPERLLLRKGAFFVAPLEQLRPARLPDYDSLIEVVTTVIKPDTWDCNGGEGAIECVPPGRLLVVTQTLAVHQELESFLNQVVQYQRLVKGESP